MRILIHSHRHSLLLTPLPHGELRLDIGDDLFAGTTTGASYAITAFRTGLFTWRIRCHSHLFGVRVDLDDITFGMRPTCCRAPAREHLRRT